MDRNCEICKHHSESGCSKWECQFEPTDSKHEVIEELKKVKAEIEEIQLLRDNPYNNHTEYSVSMTELRELFDKHISELKGETE